MKRYRKFFFFLLLCFPMSVFAELPTTFEPGRRDSFSGNIIGTSPNVRWVVPIGSPTYSAPVSANGKVLIGTLNDAEWDKRRSGSRSVLLCFDEKTGKFLWQLPLPKDYAVSSMFDAFCVGIASTPTVIGDHAFLTTGRGEVLCLDMNGLDPANLVGSNTGPYTDEAFLYTYRGTERGKVVNRNSSNVLPLAKTDADIVWRYDAFGELQAKPHDTNNCNIVYYDGLLVVNTGNSPDHTHAHFPYPHAPSLLLIDAVSGIPLARDTFGIKATSHGQWCSPAFGKVNGKEMIFYGGGNGILYAVEAPSREALWKQYEVNGKKLVPLKSTWEFQGDPRAHQPGGVVPPYVMAYGSASYSCLPTPVLDHKGRIFMLFGHDAWNGARPFRSWLACIDGATGKLLWGTGNIDGGAISMTEDSGLVYIGDRNGNFYCFDADTGTELWKLPLRGDIWATPLIAEGKIYIGTDRRMFYVLRAGVEPKIISEITMPDRIFATATTSGNTLYIAGDGFLYAVEGK
jgi:outer membrane protein assembly factor BamB